MPPPLQAAAAFGVRYRPFEEADLPFVAALYASTRQEELSQANWPQEVVDAFLQQQHEAQHAHYSAHYTGMEWLIVEVGGAAIGRLYLAEWKNEVRIVDIALLPDHRRRGIGAAILRDIIAWADGLPKPVSIHVEKYNPARHLYLRLGFEPVGETGAYDLLRREPAADQKKTDS